MTYVPSVTENVLEFERNTDTATVTFCQPRFITKIRKLAEKFPDECQITHENKDGSIVAHIPVKWIKINRRSYNLTDEQRAEMAKRFRNAVGHSQNDPNLDFDDLDDDLYT